MNDGDEELITEMLEALKRAVVYIQAFRDNNADIALTKATNAIAKAERRRRVSKRVLLETWLRTSSKQPMNDRH